MNISRLFENLQIRFFQIHLQEICERGFLNSALILKKKSKITISHQNKSRVPHRQLSKGSAY